MTRFADSMSKESIPTCSVPRTILEIPETPLIITKPTGIYLLKVNNRNTRKSCEICSKLTMNITERRQWRRKARKIHCT